MRLGFLTSYSDERVKFAKEAGFTCLEIQASPGSPLDAMQSGDTLSRVKSTLAEQGIAVSALACYFNHLEEGHEAERAEYFSKLIEMAPRLGCNVIATMSGVTAQSKASGNLDESIPAFQKTFAEHAKRAEANGVKIAFENWPGGHPWPLFINIAISPGAWDMMFDAVPSPALGLEYDPSHLVRLNIDYIAPIKRFADRIHHVHTKDTSIKTDVLNNVGYIGQGWWHYSIPSRGVVDWNAFFAELQAIEYSGDAVIEHEDPDFAGDNFDEGLHLGQKFLAQFVK
ncbi:MAG TPA: sugar phosphate isomerase/epimerase [Abditibacteriaceae bacterium]|nr:sugar phosphate isomerase/epimerase [Abditibacteriaceae bacterium]